MIGSRALPIAVLLWLLGACAAPDQLAPSPVGTPLLRGGTLRIVMPQDGPFTDRLNTPGGDPATLDPVLDAFSPLSTWELMRCCLSRSLLSNNGRATEQGGARLHPDLAAALPEISADGLRWTFQLRAGVHYAPPFSDLEVTAQDVIRGFHRALSPTLGAGIVPLYDDIVGVPEYAAGEATTISGLESPDTHTLVIRVTRPAGDLAARLALPLMVPIPANLNQPNAPFGVAEGHDDGYGRFFVSSGPYMIEGADALDFTRAPAEQLPVSGLVPGESLTLVRNPAWTETLDPLRPALADRIEFFAVPTSAEGVTALLEGRAELFVVTPFGYVPPDAADQIRASGGLARLHVNQSDFISQILINTAQPPFDDLHVRRAANYIVNKARLVELVTMGFPIRPAHHLVPDAMEDNLLVDYRPYASPADAGDLEAAKREMALSSYDTDGDGLCDAPECAGVTILSRDRPAGIGQSVLDDLAQIGIEGTLDIRETEEFFDIFADPTQHIGVYATLAWAKDAMSPAGFFLGQFYGPESFSDLSGNGALVGATPEDLRAWGYGNVEVPNVDQRIEACLPLIGAASFECWAGLDQYMMENVVPSIPFGLGLGTIGASSGVEFVWDQLAAAPSYDSIAVNP